MVNLSVVKQWLEKADSDLSFAQSTNKERGREDYVAFASQQAAEKFLKAFIIAKNLKFKYTHDLVDLLRVCAQKDKEFARLSSFAEELTPLYIESRYPEFVGVITKERAKIALAATKKIAEFVKRKLRQFYS